MSIKHAILGILSFQAASGYEMKKMMQHSPFMHWSGNNNQIYKSLLELSEDGYVTSQTEHRAGSPSKKVYFITDDGRAELNEWMLAEPALPELKNAFLIQLAWSEALSDEDVWQMLENYERQIKLQALLHKAKSRQEGLRPARSERERAIWQALFDYAHYAYEGELNWIRAVRSAIEPSRPAAASPGDASLKHPPPAWLGALDYDVIIKDGQKIVKVNSSIDSPHCGTMIVAACAEHDAELVLIPAEKLSSDFWKSKSGLAADLMQDFVNYCIRVAAIHSRASRSRPTGKARNHPHCMIFTDEGEAFDWLLRPQHNNRDGRD